MKPTKKEQQQADSPPKAAPDPTEALMAQCAEYLAGWQRERAAFQNFQKDEAARIELSRVQWMARLIREMLPAIDALRRALDGVGQDLARHEWVKGVKLVSAQFDKFLYDQGVKKIEALGREFDPAMHEAVQQVDDRAHAGHVIEVVQEGYALGDYVVRPARVKVAH